MADGQVPPPTMTDSTPYPPQGAPPPGQTEYTVPPSTSPYPPATQGAYPPHNTTPYPPAQYDPSYSPPGPGFVGPGSEQPPAYPGPPAANYPPQPGYQQGYQQPGGTPANYDPSVKVQPQPQPNVVVVQSNQHHPQQPNPNIAIVRTVQIDAGSKPETYLVMSIISTFCCLFIGMFAIVYSSQVSSLWRQGRHAEARGASFRAKGFAIAAFVVGIVIIAINVVRFVFFSSLQTPQPLQQTTNVNIVNPNQPPQQPHPNIAIVRTGQTGSPPDTHLVRSNVSLCCCPIFGIIFIAIAIAIAALYR